MTITIRPLVALAIMCAWLLSGCGGGSGHKTAVAAVRTGKATFVVRWPGRTARLIPVASNSILVTVLRNGTQVAQQLLARPDGGNTSQVTFNPLPVGDLVANAVAFPNADGTGVAQASGSAGLTIKPDTNTTITLTMGTTITHIVVTPSVANLLFGSVQNGTVMLAASARDADENVVLTSGSTYTWSTGNANIATIVPSGSTAVAHATGAGSINVSVTETESNVTGQAQVNVRGPGIAQGSWSKFRSDASNTGVGLAQNLGGTLDWSASTGGPIEASPVVAADGTVYAGSGDGNIYAFNHQGGSVKWTSFLGGHIKSTPVISADGTIFAASTNGQIAALDKADGSQKWNVSFFGSSYTSSPVIGIDGVLYIAGQDAVVRALDTANGNQIWSAGFGAAIDSSPALSADGTALYIGAGDKQMRALRTVDGAVIWNFQTAGAIQSSPALDVQTNILYFGADDGKVYAVNAATGGNIWDGAFQTGGTVSSSPALLSVGPTRIVLVGSTDGKLYAIDGASGSAFSTPFQTGGSIRSSPAVSQNGIIAFGSDDGNIYGIRLSGPNFVQTFSFTTGAGVVSSPALDNVMNLYVGSTDSNLYSLKP